MEKNIPGSRRGHEALAEYLRSHPWIRLLLPYLSGIFLALKLPREKPLPGEELQGLLVFLFLSYWLLLYRRRGMGLERWIPGSAGCVFLLCLGCCLTRGKLTLDKEDHFSKHRVEALLVRIASPPEQRGRYWRMEALVTHGVRRDTALKACGRLLLYLAGRAEEIPGYGAELFIKARYGPAPPPRNPGEFDFRSYLASKDIYHQAYLSKTEWFSTGKRGGNPLRRWATGLQKECVERIGRYFPDQDKAALLSAFVVGHRSMLGEETIQAFADTGTIHILSVSGLHVAILYWLVANLLKPLRRLPMGKMLELILAAAAIFVYALLTGLSPPICRAACMILLFALERSLGKPHNPGNSLALTAFLLLLDNPLVLQDAGFQLSFLAVSGLIGIAPRIQALYQAPNRVLGQCWSMSAVSLAAQIATFPLSLLYFHRFPVYFLPANLLLVPLSSLLLYGGVVLLPLAGWEAGARPLACLLSLLMDLLEALMEFFGGLPGAVVEGIWITPYECAGYYLLMASIAGFCYLRQKQWLKTSLCVALLLASSETLESYRQGGQRFVVYFHIRGHNVLAFLSGKDAVLFSDPALPARTYAYSVRPFLEMSGIRRVYPMKLREDFRNAFLLKQGPFLQFFHLRVALLDREFPYPCLPQGPLPVDLGLVLERAYLPEKDLLESLRLERLVAGSDLSARQDAYLEHLSSRKGIVYHSLRKGNALLIELPRTQR